MTKNDLEAIYAETFSGVCLYCRDTILDEGTIAQYATGQILRHNGIVDVTHKDSGLNGNIRYTIASARAKDVSKVNPMAANFGHFVLADETLALTGGVFFVVVDIYNVDGKTQVTLLHIKKEFTNLFANASTNLEDEIVRLARAEFNRQANSAVLPELTGSDWTERVKDPLGFDAEGNLIHVPTEQGDGNIISTKKQGKKSKWKFFGKRKK